MASGEPFLFKPLTSQIRLNLDMADETVLYPLRFAPIYQYRLWGGRKLEQITSEPLPPDQPIGEAWILSDRDDFTSTVSEGPLKGKTLTDLFSKFPAEMLGEQAGQFERYPLLLKFLDAKEMLSVQVHPSDAQKELLPPGERGKTEAWLVLEAEPQSSIFAGLKVGTTAEDLRGALATNTVEEHLSCLHPEAGEGVFIEAGTVHALGGGVVVFEVQQNSDVTFRLYDWNRVDAKTGKPRELHIEQSLQSTDFSKGPVSPSIPAVLERGNVSRERLFTCEFFEVVRIRSEQKFPVGSDKYLRTLVIIEGDGHIEHRGTSYPFTKGQVWVIPASVGPVGIQPGSSVNLVEVATPAKA